MALVLTGTVTTFDAARPDIQEGAVYIGDDGLIEAVQRAGDPAPAGYTTAARVNTRGVIYPGLIDLHNHLVYNALSLWAPPREVPYTSRDQWPRAATYDSQISEPANALGLAAGKPLLKYVETKAVVGGVTAIQGSAKLSRPYEGWLVRNVEYETFGTGKKRVYQSVRTLGEGDFPGYREHMTDGAAFIYHLAEGTDPSLVREYDALKTHDCLRPQLVAIHATALGASQFQEWVPRGGSIVWSPFSNLWLYRDTTGVAAARAAGLRICLGADWSPSGSKNLLGELKVADLWNREHLGSLFSAQELCEMATANPADALGWGDRIGRIKAGLQADLLVTADRRQDRYRNLIESTERHVRLVLVGGRAVYGTPAQMRAASAQSPEPISIQGLRRSISMKDPSIPDADLGWKEVLTRLNAARRNPQRAHALALSREAEPLRLIPDMPGDEFDLTRAFRALTTVTIPPLDSLTHEASFFAALEAAPILAGLLNGLRDYYRPD